MSIGGYQNVINNSNRFLLTMLYIDVLAKAVTDYSLDHINLKKVNQNNGKENVIIRLNRTMEMKNVFKHIIQGYILPKDKQSIISMIG